MNNALEGVIKLAWKPVSSQKMKQLSLCVIEYNPIFPSPVRRKYQRSVAPRQIPGISYFLLDKMLFNMKEMTYGRIIDTKVDEIS